MDGAYSTHGKEGKCIQRFVGKPEDIDHWEDTGIVLE
jgi:hypothetical protein